MYPWNYLHVLVGKLRPENIENRARVTALLDVSPKAASFQHTEMPSHQFPMLLCKIICLLMIAFPSNFTSLCCSTVPFPISTSTRLVGSLLWCHLSGWGKRVVGKRSTYVLKVQESHGWCTPWPLLFIPHVLLITHTNIHTPNGMQHLLTIRNYFKCFLFPFFF